MSEATEKRFGLAKGDRVVATEEAFLGGLFKRKAAPVFGTVTGFARLPMLIRVLRDNRRNAEIYHGDFWQLATSEESPGLHTEKPE